MRDHERSMLAYVLLADLSQQMQQLLGRDKFLVLAAVAACRAGWPDVASRCRQAVLDHNPSHLIGRFETMADALRDADFEPFLRRLERFCGYERAEHWLHEWNLDPQPPATGRAMSSGEYALEVLSGTHWPRPL